MALIKKVKKDVKVKEPSKNKHWSKKKNLWLMNIKSSNIKKIAYNFLKGTLYIKFETSEYKYTKVPLDWWISLTKAESKGKYFSKAKYELVNVEKLGNDKK